SRARCALAVVPLWSTRHRPSEGAWTAVAGSGDRPRERDPSSALASYIGFPAPSYKPYRRPADNGRWGWGRMSRGGASGRALRQLGEHDDALGGRVQRVAGGQDQAVVGDALRDPDGGRRDDPRALDLVREAAVGQRQRDRVTRLELVDAPEPGAVGGAVA